MFTEPILDPFPVVLGELRADVDVVAQVGTDAFGRVRVRPDEPAGQSSSSGGAVTYPGDARNPGQYQKFVVMTTLDEPPHPSVPILRGVYALNCYGATFAQARAVWAAVVKALHKVGARASGEVGIYISVIESGGEKDKDPDTGQPVVRGTVRVTASALSISPAGS